MRNFYFLFLFFLIPFLLLSQGEEIKVLASRGEVKEALEKYRVYCQKTGRHHKELLEEILFGFLRNTDPKYGYATRRDAGQLLINEVLSGKRRKEEVISILKENLKFPDTGVKVNAAKFLILLGYREKNLLPVLKEGLYKGDEVVSMDAAIFLSYIPGKESLSLLKEAMGSPNPFVAISAVKGLEKLKSEEAKKLLIKGLKYGGGKSKAGEAPLKKISFSGLMSFYTSEQVRIACAKSLSKFSGEDVVKALGEALKSSEKNLKIYALDSLGKIAKREDRKKRRGFWGRRKRDALFYIKSAVKDEELREEAYTILARLGEEEGIKYWRDKLKSNSWEEKLSALSILLELKDKEALGVLEEALSSSEKEVRKKAVSLLKYLEEDALPFLEKASQDPDWEVRKKVVSVAGGVGERGKKILERLTEDSNAQVKREAIFASAGLTLTGEWGLDFLLEEGFFGWKISRKEVALLKDKKSIVAILKKEMERADPYTKVELAEILLGLGEREVSVPILREALSWKKAPRFQKKSAYALASIGDTSALPVLEERLWKYGEREVGTVKALLQILEGQSFSKQVFPEEEKKKEKLPSHHYKKGEVIIDKTPLYHGNKIIYYLPLGAEVRLLRQHKQWYLVEYIEKETTFKGWVKKDNLLLSEE